jgi:hypothetical protein
MWREFQLISWPETCSANLPQSARAFPEKFGTALNIAGYSFGITI